MRYDHTMHASVEIGDPERRDIEVIPLVDPVPREVPYPAPDPIYDPEDEEEVEIEPAEVPDLVPA